MFNWRMESAHFTPRLRVLEHTGLARDVELIAKHDLVLSTYGTLLRDAPRLAEIEFDYVVLDEAQAIKNASTASAKAVRLLRGAHRLALSGTPVFLVDLVLIDPIPGPAQNPGPSMKPSFAT